jgi:hypothetical protein
VRDHKVFVGKLDPTGLGFGERIAVKWVRVPYGDFWDWDDIRGWAREIATELHSVSITLPEVSRGAINHALLTTRSQKPMHIYHYLTHSLCDIPYRVRPRPKGHS